MDKSILFFGLSIKNKIKTVVLLVEFVYMRVLYN